MDFIICILLSAGGGTVVLSYADRAVRMVGYVCTSHVHIEYTPSTRFVGLTETNKKREPHGSLLTVGLGLPHELLGLWLGLIKRRRVLF